MDLYQIGNRPGAGSYAPTKCDARKYPILGPDDLRRMVGNRELLIWGAGQKGRGFRAALRRNQFDISAFVDKRESAQSAMVDGKTVLSPDGLFETYAPDEVLILLASVDLHNREMATQLEARGFTRDRDFADIQLLSPLYPTVEVTGICNLKCPSCLRTAEDIIPQGKYMSLAQYKEVMGKLVKDIPFLYLVDLYVWGEPMLNPEIAEMVSHNHSLGVATGLSTNLNNIRNLEAVLAQHPAQIRVSISGMSQETYERTHVGGRWSKVRPNLDTLRDLRTKYGNVTEVEFYFHTYKHNLHEYQLAKDLCRDYGFNFHPALGNIIAQDFIASYRSGNALRPETQAVSELLLVNLEQLIRDCDEDTDKNCILTRVTPTINWDMSVMPCCQYTYSSIHPNFLEADLSDLIELRTNSDTCADCQSFSLHRWNDQVKYAGHVREIGEAQS